MSPNQTPDEIREADADERDERQQAVREQMRQALEHRFRLCLKSGQISPLFHLMLRYKTEALQ